MKLEIKEPCHEDWNKMKIGLISRHCAVCDKGVMDFTKMNRAEIITYILSNPNEQVCGRMNRDQFDFHHEDIPILIETLKKDKTSNPFLILALVCISLSATAQDMPPSHIKTPPPIEKTMGKPIVSPPDSSDTTTDEVPPVKIMLKGKVACEPTIGDIAYPIDGGISIEPVSPRKGEKRVHQFAEQMPEFKGGIDSLFAFVSNNLKYPDYEKKKGIEGNVYVRFIVELDGRISTVEVLQTVERYVNFDNEVLRLIQSMPNWKPGKNNGKEVPVYMTLPIRFVLK
jgi:TonB family protein